MDLNTLSTEELLKLQKDLPLLLQQRQAERLSATQAAVLKLIEESGLSRKEVLEPLVRVKRAPQKFPKYQHPKNPQQVWLGRGKQPNWLRELIASGKKLEDFRVE